MEVDIDKRKLRPSLLFRAFRAYLRFFHNKIYFRRVTFVGRENIPPDGTPLIIACNHQNCMNDPLHILFSLRRKACFLARADVFSRPLVAKWLRRNGLLPAYRMSFDGESALSKNASTWDVAGTELLSGRTLVIFPEAGHQDNHWLGEFSLGYIRLAFETAARADFATDIKILPACNHYEDYFHMRKDVVIRYGTPISLADYYELYRTKPRTAQREASRKVREQMLGLMLSIDDQANYEAIDYIRNTYGHRYATACGASATHLDEKLTTDRQLVAALDAARQSQPEQVEQLYADVLRLKSETRRLNLRDWNFDKAFSAPIVALQIAVRLLLLPLFVFALVPNILIYHLPKLITRRLKDRLFTSSVNFGVSVLVTIPLLYAITFAFDWYFTESALLAAIHVISLPLLGLFAYRYYIDSIKVISEIRCERLRKTNNFSELAALRSRIFGRLDQLVKSK